MSIAAERGFLDQIISRDGVVEPDQFGRMLSKTRRPWAPTTRTRLREMVRPGHDDTKYVNVNAGWYYLAGIAVGGYA